MSRTPLLLRSSPALGTGSYGALPHNRLSSSSEDDGSAPDKRFLRQTVSGTVSKGKHALRKAYTVDDGDAYERDYHNDNATTSREGHGQTIRSEGGLSLRKGRRRRSSLPVERCSTPGEEEQSDTAFSDNELINSEGLESRFTGSTLSTFAPLGKTISRGSTPKSMSDEREDDDDDDDDDLPEGAAPPPADDSPYAQVRASVPPTDNITLSINTPRMWILSIVFAIFGSSTNLFFSLRYPSVSITPVIALLIVHPLGLLWDTCLKSHDDPDEVFVNGTLQHFETRRSDGSVPGHKLGKWTRRVRLWLAQGCWNEKEHCCVFIASNVSFGFAFATDVWFPQISISYSTCQMWTGCYPTNTTPKLTELAR
jgi:hypothetical protein